VELADLPIPLSASEAEENAVLQREGENILSKIKQSDFVTALCIEGVKLSSVKFADKIASAFMRSSSLVFVIGGSLGLSPAVKERADFRLSMSDMTFPHNLARLMLTEQIYRAFKINANETYHK
jgi:23S rRNA (pseudouridine1915-N3)-methyltransferase